MSLKSVNKIAIISTFPPVKCGIASYASQMVNSLKQQDNLTIQTISVNHQNNVDKSLRLCGGLNFLKIIPVIFYYDKIIINYHKSFFLFKHHLEF